MHLWANAFFCEGGEGDNNSSSLAGLFERHMNGSYSNRQVSLHKLAPWHTNFLWLTAHLSRFNPTSDPSSCLLWSNSPAPSYINPLWELVLFANCTQPWATWEESHNKGLFRSGWPLGASVEDWLVCFNWGGKMCPLWVVPFPGLGGPGLYERKPGELVCKQAPCMHAFLSALDYGCNVTSYLKWLPWLPPNNPL